MQPLGSSKNPKVSDWSSELVKQSPKQRHRRLGGEQIVELVERCKSGETIYELGDAYKINRKPS
jgi:hypothetical protein